MFTIQGLCCTGYNVLDNFGVSLRGCQFEGRGTCHVLAVDVDELCVLVVHHAVGEGGGGRGTPLVATTTELKKIPRNTTVKRTFHNSFLTLCKFYYTMYRFVRYKEAFHYKEAFRYVEVEAYLTTLL